MGRLLDELKEYFNNTPEDVLDKEWKEIKFLNEIGPDVIEYIDAVISSNTSIKYESQGANWFNGDSLFDLAA